MCQAKRGRGSELTGRKVGTPAGALARSDSSTTTPSATPRERSHPVSATAFRRLVPATGQLRPADLAVLAPPARGADLAFRPRRLRFPLTRTARSALLRAARFRTCTGPNGVTADGRDEMLC